MRDTPFTQARKWSYFRLVCVWVGIGSLVKLAALRMTYVAREQTLATAKERGDEAASDSLLAPISKEDQRYRHPRVLMPGKNAAWETRREESRAPAAGST